MKHKIYCFNNGGPVGLLDALALGDDGYLLAHHVCSDQSFMHHDLGMDGSTWKHSAYDEHFGLGNWELEWIDDPFNHLDFIDAFTKNIKRQLG